MRVFVQCPWRSLCGVRGVWVRCVACLWVWWSGLSVGCHPLGLVDHFSPTRSSKKFPAPVVPSLSEPWRRRDVPRAGRRPPRRAARGSPPSGRPSAARRGARRSAAPAGASPRRSPRRPEALVRLSPHRVSRVGCVASSCCGLQKLCVVVCVFCQFKIEMAVHTRTILCATCLVSEARRSCASSG